MLDAAGPSPGSSRPSSRRCCGGRRARGARSSRPRSARAPPSRAARRPAPCTQPGNPDRAPGADRARRRAPAASPPRGKAGRPRRGRTPRPRSHRASRPHVRDVWPGSPHMRSAETASPRTRTRSMAASASAAVWIRPMRRSSPSSSDCTPIETRVTPAAARSSTSSAESDSGFASQLNSPGTHHASQPARSQAGGSRAPWASRRRCRLSRRSRAPRRVPGGRSRPSGACRRLQRGIERADRAAPASRNRSMRIWHGRTVYAGRALERP